MNAICFGCKAIHRGVPSHVVRTHQQNNTELCCPRCNTPVMTFDNDDELFNIRVEIENRTYALMAMAVDGSEGQLTFVEVEE